MLFGFLTLIYLPFVFILLDIYLHLLCLDRIDSTDTMCVVHYPLGETVTANVKSITPKFKVKLRWKRSLG